VTVHENRDGVASNFLAAEIAALTTLWCYAKITPAALHRGSFAKRGDENGEAVGCRWNFGRAIFGARSTTHREVSHTHTAWHDVKQGLPAA
jgi:hypothetical protein